MRPPSPLVELTLARLRSFFREPGIIFWSFGFPLALTLTLGIAFRNRPPEPINVGIEISDQAQSLIEALKARDDVKPRLLSPDEASRALRTGKVSIVVTGSKPVTYIYDSMRPESRVARAVVDDVLQRAAGRKDVQAVTERLVSEPGARYIDFLVPGLIGMNIMSSGMWGIGYVIVDMRTRRLLKRLAATPMKRSHFLLSFIFARVLFLFVELPIVLLFAKFVFGVSVQGSLPLFALLSLLGTFAFSGLGLLVASRAQNTQTVSGLINLVMMPMFLFSGVFFSSANFPDFLQPLIRVLPLTALNDALRAVANEGAGLPVVVGPALVLTSISVISVPLSVRLFRWS